MGNIYQPIGTQTGRLTSNSINISSIPKADMKYNTPGNITHKQLVRSWNKVARDYIKEGKSVFNVTASAYNEGYNQAKGEFDGELKRLRDALKQADNTRTEAAVKLANAMSQAVNALSESMQKLI